MCNWTDLWIQQENGKWFWYDEGYGRYGPFEDKEKAREALLKYAEFIT